MKKTLVLLVLFLSPAIRQNNNGNDIDIAFQNARKGIYYALSYIPENKSRMSRELVDNNKLLAKLKLSKEIDGIKIESTGYDSSTEVTIKVYRSFESLIKDGYMKKKEEDKK